MHSAQVALQDPSPIDLAHLLGVAGTFMVMALSYVNQIAPRDNRQAPPLPAELPYVAAVVPTYGEPLDGKRQDSERKRAVARVSLR